MRLIGSILVLVALAQAFEDDIDWSTIKPRHVFPRIKTPITRIPIGKIVGGHEATPNSIPYQAALIISTHGGNFFCGGSLISQRTVLTAAHCVEGANSIQVILGAHFVNSVEDTQVRITTTSYTIHERWDSASLVNDIALVHLPSAVSLNENIQVVALPTSDELGDFAGQTARISGWGRDSDHATGISPVLRYVNAPVITNSVCNTFYSGWITDGHICTDGGGGIGSCSGDSGGPLVFNEMQIGIVSFGVSMGCEVNWPSAFTRVTEYISWIERNS